MIFRVIEGGAAKACGNWSESQPATSSSTIQIARATIIDRVAEAIYASDEPPLECTSWDELKARAGDEPRLVDHVERYRLQARFAIQAMKTRPPSDGPPETEFLIFGRLNLEPEELANSWWAFDAYIGEVLA